ncbi:hypothetical protein [Pantoea agglomerans]|uniref:Uncharacterized protein n=1 Tax=Enterobacter agglomerans TaxID=549 RepID=A0AAN2FHA2_ENTAG|nr:hypothetical protein [Pantoea agglomerans]CAH6375195.1 hypothetical protein DAPPPG734_23895 [Pantoea agglomerans]
MVHDDTTPVPDSLLIRIKDGRQSSGNMLFRLEKFNTRPVPDAAIRPLAENFGYIPAFTDITIEQLATYIADVIRQVSPGMLHADVWTQTKAPVKNIPAVCRDRVMSEDEFKDWQMVNTFMKGKHTS